MAVQAETVCWQVPILRPARLGITDEIFTRRRMAEPERYYGALRLRSERSEDKEHALSMFRAIPPAPPFLFSAMSALRQ
jgi:hypothetical protein